MDEAKETIQAAINSASASDIIRCRDEDIFIETLLINKSLTITAYLEVGEVEGCTIRGVGPSNSRIISVGTSTSCSLHIDHFTVDGQLQYNGIYSTTNSSVYAENLYVKRCIDGFWTSNGGGIHNLSRCIIYNCTIACFCDGKNSVDNIKYDHLTISNCIAAFWSSKSDESRALVSNCIINNCRWDFVSDCNNPPSCYLDRVGVYTLRYSCSYVTEVHPWARKVIEQAGIIYTDPLLESVVSEDFSLKKKSPCRDSGDPAYPKDPDGSRTDMGAIVYFWRRPMIIQDIIDRFYTDIHEEQDNSHFSNDEVLASLGHKLRELAGEYGTYTAQAVIPVELRQNELNYKDIKPSYMQDDYEEDTETIFSVLFEQSPSAKITSFKASGSYSATFKSNDNGLDGGETIQIFNTENRMLSDLYYNARYTVEQRNFTSDNKNYPYDGGLQTLFKYDGTVFDVGDTITIVGTTLYDGDHTVVEVPYAGAVVIDEAWVLESYITLPTISLQKDWIKTVEEIKFDISRLGVWVRADSAYSRYVLIKGSWDEVQSFYDNQILPASGYAPRGTLFIDWKMIPPNMTFWDTVDGSGNRTDSLPDCVFPLRFQGLIADSVALDAMGSTNDIRYKTLYNRVEKARAQLATWSVSRTSEPTNYFGKFRTNVYAYTPRDFRTLIFYAGRYA